ncbi:MAG: DUF945 family protein [Mariprofundaceae bacterium]|nr:DUF945 family protein [Mariprofundaceae bacterium]
MKKYLLLLTGIAAAVMVGAPFATGMMAEKHYRTMIQASLFEPALQLESLNFEQGIFSSQATTFIKVTDLTLRRALIDKLGKDENGNVGLLVHHHISHGPVIFGTGKGIDFAMARATHQIAYNGPAGNSAGQESGKAADLFRIDTRLYFDGSQTVGIESREILAGSSKSTTTVMPLSATFTTDKNYRMLKGDGDWKGMVSENGRGEKVSASDIRFKLDMEKSGELWLGSVLFNQHSITFSSPKTSLQIEGLEFKHQSSVSGSERLVGSASELSIQQLATATNRFGPGEMILAITNVPATALERLNALRAQAMNTPSPQRDFALQAATIEAFGLLPELLSHGIVIDMERLYLNTPGGDFIGHFRFSLPKSNPASLMNIPWLKSIIALDAGFSLPAPLVPEATMKSRIQPLLERGYLKMDGGVLKADIQMRDGILTVNDKVMALPY